MDYWHEAVAETACEIGLDLTDEQIKAFADSMEIWHENYGMAHGHDVASANLHAQQSREEDELRQRLEYEQTVPRKRCESCKGRGHHTDGWGREFDCNSCDGRGSTPLYGFKLRPPA